MKYEIKAELLEQIIAKQDEIIQELNEFLDKNKEEDNDSIDLEHPDYHNQCEKCGNTFWTKDAMDVICESCKSSPIIKDTQDETAEEWLINQGYKKEIILADKTKTEPTFQFVTVARLLNDFARQGLKGELIKFKIWDLKASKDSIKNIKKDIEKAVDEYLKDN